MDFGVGRDIQDDGPGTRAGTPLYLAPEVLLGGAATVQSEIYSLGVLLYHLVTGSYPYQAQTVAGLIDAQRQPHPSLSQRRHDLPSAFSDAVERALSRDPLARFVSSAAFGQALAAALPHPPIEAPAVRSWRPWAMVAGLVVTVIAALTWNFSVRPVALPPANTVAVVPFQDLSADQSTEYLARGLADLLTTGLGARTELRVLARTTAQEFVGNQRPFELAREIGADRLIEGSVLPNGDHVRVSLRILHAGSGNTLWAGEIVGSLTALKALEEQMVQTVTARLGEKLSPSENPAKWQADAASLEDYFRGWGEYWRLTREGFHEAERLFKSAAARSPSFAEAHAAYAYARLTDELSNREATYEEGVREARDSAATALRLDPESALAEATIGWERFYAEWDWRGAEEHLQKAIAKNPSDPQVRWMYGQLLMAQNRLDAALAEARLVRRLDPLNPARNSNVATVLYYDRRYDEAQQEVSKVLARDPNAPYARFGLSRMLSALGRNDEALTWIRTAAHLNEPFVTAELARQLLVLGRNDEARPLLKALEVDYHSGRLAPDYLAFVRLAQGDPESAIALIEEAVRQHSGTVIWIHVDPRFDALRRDVRFVDALRTMGLAPALH
jgi:serine/threonine-protein kinase